MPRVLVIDDDTIQIELIKTALSRLGYQILTAANGTNGLMLAKAEQPDLIVLDVCMPGIDGFEVARRLRRDPATKNLLIMMLTALSQVSDKVEAFSIGVDDYLTKPFEISELAARVSSLLRRAEGIRKQADNNINKGRLIAVHSLRGGIGCSSIALNLALGLYNIWRGPTLLIDNNFVSGQIALMLDTPARRTWADLAMTASKEFEREILQSSITVHESGLHFLAAPNDPVEGVEVDEYVVKAAISGLQSRYEYIIADLAHDFSNPTLQALEAAERVLLILAPEIVSVRLAANTLRVYKELDFSEENVELVLVKNAARSTLTPKQIERALRQPISYVLPYAPEAANKAIAMGVPFLANDPNNSLSIAIEDLAFYQSSLSHREIPPPEPSAAWRRVHSRINPSKNGQSTNSQRLPLFGRLGKVSP